MSASRSATGLTRARIIPNSRSTTSCVRTRWRVANFRRDPTQGGPHLELYDIGPTRTPREKPEAPGADADEITLRPTATNRVRHGSGPVPFARHALHRLAIEAGAS